MNYQWNLSSGPDEAAGQADDIAHAVDALHRALDEMAETSIAGDIEGAVIGGGDEAPFWMLWHPLTPAEAGEPTRDIAGTRATITELAESLRAELHRTEDQRVLAA